MSSLLARPSLLLPVAAAALLIAHGAPQRSVAKAPDLTAASTWRRAPSAP